MKYILFFIIFFLILPLSYADKVNVTILINYNSTNYENYTNLKEINNNTSKITLLPIILIILSIIFSFIIIFDRKLFKLI